MSTEDLKPIWINKEYLENCPEDDDLIKGGWKTDYAYIVPLNIKRRFKALSQVMKDMIDNSNVGKIFKIDEEMHHEFLALLSSLIYLMNSTSFIEGKYMDFDKIEIDRKLGRK